MKKFGISIAIIVLLIVSADFIIGQDINNIFHMDKNLNLATIDKSLDVSDNVNVSATPNGAISFEDITQITVNSFDIPIKIEEADVTQVTVLDSSVLNGVPLDAKNTIFEKNGILKIKQCGNDNKTKNFSCVSGEFLIQVPLGTALDYDINCFSSDVFINALSKDINVQTFSSITKVLKGGNNLTINQFSGTGYVYETFNNIDYNTFSGDIYLVLNEATQNIKGTSFSSDIIVELNTENTSNLKLSSLSGNVVVQNWRD